MTSLRDRLIGAWTLQSYTAFPLDGSAPFHPLGEDAQGIILYTPDGYMSAQLMRKDRPPFATDDLFDGTTDEYRQAAAYIGYSGGFEVDEEMATVTHHVAVSFFPGWLERAQIRSVSRDHHRLTLGAETPIRSGGREVLSRLEWRRPQA